MSWPGVDLQLPLLQRELQVLSQKKFTYVARAACAVGIFWYALTFGLFDWNRSSSLFWYLGKGRNILDRVVEAELFGVYVLLPAWMCGLIAAEKERQTLPLLLTTRLGVWRIIFEKYCTGMLRVLVILFLSIPVLAVAYPLGGFTQTDLLRGVWTIFICALSVGAITLFSSCWCATTSGAFLTTYAILLFLGAFPFLLHWMAEDFWGLTTQQITTWTRRTQYHGLMWFYPFLFYVAPMGTTIQGNFWSVLAQFTFRSIAVFIQTALFLGLARRVFVTRALDPDNTWFRRWRRIWNEASTHQLTRANTLPPPRQLPHLPEYAPIAWRESRGAFLGTKFCVMIALLGAAIKYVLLQDSKNAFVFMLFTFCEFVAVTLILVSLVTGLIQKERMRQTWDVLLVTPLSTKELLQQKLQRVWNIWGWFCLYLAILPLGFSLGVLTVSPIHSHPVSRELLLPTQWNYLFCGLVYLPVLIWMSLLISLYCKSQGKALITIVLSVVGWTLIPLAALTLFFRSIGLLPASNRDAFLNATDFILLLLAWVSPLGLHIARNFFESFRHSFLLVVTLYATTAAWHLGLLYVCRNRLLNLIVSKLGRLEPLPRDPAEQPFSPANDPLVPEGVA